LQVLVVEDDCDLREALCELLGEHGHSVVGVGTATAALDRIARGWRGSCLLVDLNLPDMPGEELIRRVRAEPSHRESVIIAVTGAASPGPIAGSNAMLAKPFDFGRLTDLLDAFASREDAG
jgi:CheY-like chemotaxis protein